MVGDIHACKFAIVGITQINLRESNDSVPDTHELHDSQMFFGLRLPTFVAINYQDARVNSADAGQHVANEFGVPWHVNEGNAVAAGQLHMGKPKIDGETTFLFFNPTVRINASEAANQC